MTKKLPVILAAAAAAALALLAAQRAVAQQVTFRVDTPEFGFRIGTPVYPAPVLIGPAPVYAPPPVVYTAPPRVIYQPPLAYAPPPVVIGPQPVYVVPRLCTSHRAGLTWRRAGPRRDTGTATTGPPIRTAMMGIVTRSGL